MTVTAYPLQWPDKVPRTPDYERRNARFGKETRAGGLTGTRSLTVAEATARLTHQLGLMDANTVTVSTEMKLRQDGLPHSGIRPPDDPGVAVYFRLLARPYCLPCDRWDRVADNLAAVAAHIGAMRGMERWGVGSVEQAFAGYMALPEPEPDPDWWDVLHVPRDAELTEITAAYREKARTTHPDRGGGTDAMARLNHAMDQARSERN